jgi:anthrone oxygenase-like protein
MSARHQWSSSRRGSLLSAGTIHRGPSGVCVRANHPARAPVRLASGRRLECLHDTLPTVAFVVRYRRATLDHNADRFSRQFVSRGLASLASFAGLSAWWQTGHWAWLLAAVVLIANWPYILLGIMPTNKKLMTTDPAGAGPGTATDRRLGGLHAVRTGLGLAPRRSFCGRR